jgi:hypothetical protein
MRETLRTTTALGTAGGPLAGPGTGGGLVSLKVGGYLSGVLDLSGRSAPERKLDAFGESCLCSDGEIYFKGETLLARLLSA